MTREKETGGGRGVKRYTTYVIFLCAHGATRTTRVVLQLGFFVSRSRALIILVDQSEDEAMTYREHDHKETVTRTPVQNDR